MPSEFPANPILNSPFRRPERHFGLGAGGAPTGTILEGRRPGSGLVEELRRQVGAWRALPPRKWAVSGETERLLRHWRDPERRANRLFFCQLEAAETIIWIAERAPADMRTRLAAADPELGRLAIRMATGTGKTTVMAMLIAWHAANKAADRDNPAYSDNFLILCPGLTIRERLRVLLPGHAENCYEAQDLVPPEMLDSLSAARIRIVNVQAFKPRPPPGATTLARALLRGREEQAAAPEIRIGRACAGLGGPVLVLNDEAHHCWRGEGEEGRIWLQGIEAVRRRLGLRGVYDFSATPFFLRGSGRGEGTLFPWVVGDFPLIDAIESGIVKVPRRAMAETGGDPLRAVEALYPHYREVFESWRAAAMPTPPVFIIVCGTTRLSRQVFDHVRTQLPLFRPEPDGTPRTLLIDSAQLESGEAMGTDFRRAAAGEIRELRRRAGRELSDEELLREAMRTIGRPGKLGAPIRCVVSVAMLTEGWDARTVTHILGLRAFASQLLCEQVAGRGLRRVGPAGERPAPEFVDISGIPLAFMAPASATAPKPPPAPFPVILRDRPPVRYPRVIGYRAGFPVERLHPAFSAASRLATGEPAGEAREGERVFALASLTLQRWFRDGEGNPKTHLFPDLVTIATAWMRDWLEGGLATRMLEEEAARRIARSCLLVMEGDGHPRPVLDPRRPEGSGGGSGPILCTDAEEEAFCRSLDAMPETLAFLAKGRMDFAIPYVAEGEARHWRPDFILRLDAGRGWGDAINLVIARDPPSADFAAEKAAAMRTLWLPCVNADGRFGRWDFLAAKDAAAIRSYLDAR